MAQFRRAAGITAVISASDLKNAHHVKTVQDHGDATHCFTRNIPAPPEADAVAADMKQTMNKMQL